MAAAAPHHGAHPSGRTQWYAPTTMPRRPLRVSVPASLLSALCGAVVGLGAFAVAGALWRVGQVRAAGAFADSILVSGLALVAAITLLAQPARWRRARVPVGRALPASWWPATADPVPALAACFGAPLALGAGAAVLIFR